MALQRQVLSYRGGVQSATNRFAVTPTLTGGQKSNSIVTAAAGTLPSNGLRPAFASTVSSARNTVHPLMDSRMP